MDKDQQKRIVEAIVLASPEPVAPTRIAELIPRCNPSQVRSLVKELNGEYEQQRRAFEIWEVAGGYQLRSLPEFAPYLKQLKKIRSLRLSQAALETLSIIAYRQPLTRAEIEHVRGVDAGAMLRSLLERHLVRIAGHREVPGRPIVYATSRRFLEVFGLAKLGDLPALRDLVELDSEGGEEAPVTPLAEDEAAVGAPLAEDEAAAGAPLVEAEAVAGAQGSAGEGDVVPPPRSTAPPVAP